MKKQEKTESAVTATVDEAGLLTELLAGKPAEQSEFEVLLEKPPTSTREKIIRAAIEAVQSGEFTPTHGYYRAALYFTNPNPLPCGCAAAALYYGGVRLELVPDKQTQGLSATVEPLEGYFPRQEMEQLERRYEKGNPQQYKGARDNRFEPHPEDAEHMIECLNSLLDQKE